MPFYICESCNCGAFFVANLFNIRLNNDFYYMNTHDGLHPDEEGMKIIAEVVIDAFLNKMKVGNSDSQLF